jgi:hypothetical protein
MSAGSLACRFNQAGGRLRSYVLVLLEKPQTAFWGSCGLMRIACSACAHPFQKLRHRTGCIRDVLFDPCNRNVGVQFLELVQFGARLINLPCLCKTRAKNPMARSPTGPLLEGLAAEIDCLAVAPSLIMRCRKCREASRKAGLE